MGQIYLTPNGLASAAAWASWMFDEFRAVTFKLKRTYELLRVETSGALRQLRIVAALLLLTPMQIVC